MADSASLGDLPSIIGKSMWAEDAADRHLRFARKYPSIVKRIVRAHVRMSKWFTERESNTVASLV